MQADRSREVDVVRRANAGDESPAMPALPTCPRGGSEVGSCDRVQEAGWRVRAFQGDEVAGSWDLGELGVAELPPVGLPV